ncbi:hypothetical protein DERF_013093 [Dermatophagoides farinae]|uniref:Uncharacterized protein n=1 Tax=Dermatophagoides farinae TaxID=6954 RepID=A0A922KY48_DERFA|nr:hypothetical protein DERF_013093 [Dermatophagoides farinae]
MFEYGKNGNNNFKQYVRHLSDVIDNDSRSLKDDNIVRILIDRWRKMSTGYYDHKPGHQQKQQQQRFSRKQQMMI